MIKINHHNLRVIAILLSLAATASLSLAKNEKSIAIATDCLQADSQLSAAWQARLMEAAKVRLSAGPEMCQDKIAHFQEHLISYLNEALRNTSQLDDQQFQVVVDVFDWQLHNYLTLPCIDDNVRSTGKQRIDQLKDGVSKFIKTTYTDTPADVQQQLIDQADASLLAVESNIGNYFHPELLYLQQRAPDSAWVISKLSTQPFIDDNGKKFADVKMILDNTSLPEGSRKVHIGFFVNREGWKLQNAVKTVAAGIFDTSPLGSSKDYAPPSQALLAEQMQLGAELASQAKTAGATQMATAAHDGVVNNILAGSGVSVNRGIVKLPDNLIDDVEEPASTSSPALGTATHATPNVTIAEVKGHASGTGKLIRVFNIVVFLAAVTAVGAIWWRISAKQRC